MEIAIILKSPYDIGEVIEQNVIFADAGYKFKDKLADKTVLSVVGDFDSYGNAPLGENVIKLNEEKNYTDGEFAVRHAKSLGATGVTIYGATGGKIEHILGNLALLKIAKEIGLNAKIKTNDEIIILTSGSVKIFAKKNTKLSIITYGESCVVTASKGLYYPLENLTLKNGDTRGISNVVTQETVEFCVSRGEALVIYYLVDK